MSASPRPLGSDPADRLVNPAPTQEAAGYLIEMLSSMSHFAHAADLNNSAVMLAAAAQVLDQECRLITETAPLSSGGSGASWPFPYGPEGAPSAGDQEPG